MPKYVIKKESKDGVWTSSPKNLAMARKVLAGAVFIPEGCPLKWADREQGALQVGVRYRYLHNNSDGADAVTIVKVADDAPTVATWTDKEGNVLSTWTDSNSN